MTVPEFPPANTSMFSNAFTGSNTVATRRETVSGSAWSPPSPVFMARGSKCSITRPVSSSNFGFQRRPVRAFLPLAFLPLALAPFLSRFSLRRWQGRPPLLQLGPVLQSGLAQAGGIRLLKIWRLPNARRVRRSRSCLPAGLLRLARSRWQPGLGRRTRPLLQPLPVRKVRWLLSRPVWRSRLLRAWPLRQTVLPLRAGLSRLVGAVRIVQRGIGAPQGALLGHDLAAEILC